MWLEGTGLEILVDVSIAALSRILDPAWSDINQQEKAISARDVELLISLFQSGKRVISVTPLRFFVEGRCVDGGTVRKIGPPAADLLKRLS